MNPFDESVKDNLDARLSDLEKEFNSDVIFFYGPIYNGMFKLFRDFIETLVCDKDKRETLTIFLNTPGGSVETVEKVVRIIRYHYDYVNIVVPDMAMSAGTIFCMAGDKIFMDYSSSLGPIDPQVYNGKEWVPAQGYLDKVEELIQKSRDDCITKAEFLILQTQDLAVLRAYEQAKNLTVTLLKEWLVSFKFKDWEQHKNGTVVTREEKIIRAEEVAKLLGDNTIWHSHGRMLGIDTLENVLKLKIENYTDNKTLHKKIRTYNDLTTEFIARREYPSYFHSRNYF